MQGKSWGRLAPFPELLIDSPSDLACKSPLVPGFPSVAGDFCHAL